MTPSKVCIDGFNLALPRGSGIATYARNLNDALRALGHQTQILYGPAGALGGDNLLNEVTLHDAPRVGRPRWREGVARAGRMWRAGLSAFGRTAIPIFPTGTVSAGPAAVAAEGAWAARDLFHAANAAFAMHRRFTPVTFAAAQPPDITHWTCPLPLRGVHSTNLYTIHDLVPLSLPYATLDNKRAFHALCARICATADHVVTVSESSKAEIMRVFGVDEGRITNTYQAVDVPAALRARPDEEIARENEAVHGLGWRGYYLFFGAIEPKKNLARLIEAYLTSGVADPLVVVGAPGWLHEPETALIQNEFGDRVRRIHYLPFTMLVSLIRGAKAVLFPSVSEGFGLPVLEAMQLGAPVLASTAGALPEVAGEAALLVDPFDVQAIKGAILSLDADEGLRTELATRGRAQAEKFSPWAYGERLGELYARIG